MQDREAHTKTPSPLCADNPQSCRVGRGGSEDVWAADAMARPRAAARRSTMARRAVVPAAAKPACRPPEIQPIAPARAGHCKIALPLGDRSSDSGYEHGDG